MEHAEHAGLLPLWVRVAWVIAFSVIAVVHGRHAWVMVGQRRYWHSGHVVMAAGMAHMYLPLPAHVLPAAVGVGVFAAAAAAALAVAACLRLRTGALNPLWLLATAEMAVMAYMFLPTSTRPLLVSWVLAAYLACVGLLWAVGTWDRYYRPGDAASPLISRASQQGASPPGSSAPVFEVRGLRALRTSLVAMTAGMAYMLLTM